MLISWRVCSFFFFDFSMSVCRARRGVLSSFCYFNKLGSKPGPFVKNNKAQFNLQLFSSQIHYISLLFQENVAILR